MDFAKAVDLVISEHLSELTKPGVISIRPGYQSAGHWLTKKPAIVVTVERKRDDVSASDRLPETLGGYSVDVREADAVQKLRMTNQALFTAVAAGARPEMWRPVFPYERFIAGPNMAATEEAIAALRRPQKPQVEYSGPADASLDVVEDDVTIICHASPDAGWPTLKPFLEQTKARMTIGMYDFTSGHILDRVKSALKDDKVSLVLDHPAPNKTRDQTDEDTVTALRTEFGGRFEFAWALERMDGMASAWIYPNAYHIKVAVRDGTAFWLSSGNWNNSNQPDIDPLSDPAGSATVARKSDRDWHVIVFHKGLASTYEKYLLNDLKVAEQHQTEEAAASLTSLIGELAEPPLPISPKTPKTYFPPRTITKRMRIQPILTPDNYVQKILPLISGAKKSFYMQTQYIHPSDKQGDEGLAGLIAAVAQKMRDGLDVRLILSQYETLDKLELLQDAGIDLANVRIQANVHNKGMIVDSQIVVLGSQNWSADGVLRNRDASLIIYDEDAARYWEAIFIHDWTNMSSQQAVD